MRRAGSPPRCLRSWPGCVLATDVARRFAESRKLAAQPRAGIASDITRYQGNCMKKLVNHARSKRNQARGLRARTGAFGIRRSAGGYTDPACAQGASPKWPWRRACVRCVREVGPHASHENRTTQANRRRARATPPHGPRAARYGGGGVNLQGEVEQHASGIRS